jgi:transposase
MKTIRFVGLDVHSDKIAVAIAEPDGELRFLGVIPNREDSVRRMVRKLGDPKSLRTCYEAGPTGFVLYWQLTAMGVECDVVAPTLVPVKSGDRVMTHVREAEKLARCLRAGDLTTVWVPDAAHEALRDLARARECALRDELRAKHRLGRFLLRHGKRRPDYLKAVWTTKHLKWIKTEVHFEQHPQEVALTDYVHEVEHAMLRIERLNLAIQEAARSVPPQMRAVMDGLQTLRGVAEIAAITIVAYSGLVPSEFSTGNRTVHGGITKTGNAHLRRVVMQAACAYQYRPWLGGEILKRQAGASAEVREIARKTQNRLHMRYQKLLSRRKNKNQIVTAVGRELLGFIWAIGVAVEREMSAAKSAAA